MQSYRKLCLLAHVLSVTVPEVWELFIEIFCVVNPPYTDTRYNDKSRYNDNLNVTKPSVKR